MKYLKKFNEAVAIEDKNSKNILVGDNFSLPKNLKFPEIEDLDMYLQLIEDDGGVVDIADHLIENKWDIDVSSKFFSDVEYLIEYKYIRIIDVHDSENISFIEEFKEKYSKSDVWDIYILGGDDISNYIEIRFVSKEIINTQAIVKQFNNDVEKFLNDNRDIMKGYTESFKFSTAISHCECSNLDLLKDRLELFLNSHKYYIGVNLNRNRRMIFNISLSLN